MKTPIAIIISGIVIAISIVVSTKMYVDANRYTFTKDGLCAYNQDGERYEQRAAYDGKNSLVWRKQKSLINKLP